MNCLILGAEGNLGSYIVKSIRVHHPTAQIYGTKRCTNGYFSVENTQENRVKRINCDLTRLEHCQKIFSKYTFDYVINCAALLYGVAGFNKKTFSIFNNDVKIQLNLIQCCIEAKRKPKYIYISSSMVYENANTNPFFEHTAHDLPSPNTSYGMTKTIGEKIIFYADEEFGLNYTIWRPFNIISPLEEKREKGYSHVAVDFAYTIFKENKKEVNMFGDGMQTRCFTWIEDIADFIVAHMDDKRTDKNIFNIGTEEEITIKGMGNLMVDIAKEQGYFNKDYKVKFIPTESQKKDVKFRKPSLEKVRLLGFEATPLRQTFTKFLKQGGYI